VATILTILVKNQTTKLLDVIFKDTQFDIYWCTVCTDWF